MELNLNRIRDSDKSIRRHELLLSPWMQEPKLKKKAKHRQALLRETGRTFRLRDNQTQRLGCHGDYNTNNP